MTDKKEGKTVTLDNLLHELTNEEFHALQTGGWAPGLETVGLYQHTPPPARPDCLGEYKVTAFGYTFLQYLQDFARRLPVGAYLALRSVPESDGADWEAAVTHKLMIVTEHETGCHDWTPLGNAVKHVVAEALSAGT